MKRDHKTPGATLLLESTGRRLEANGGLLSIDLETGEVFEGYDNRCEHDDPDSYYGKPFTVDERREIAETMIAAWRKFGGLDVDRAMLRIVAGVGQPPRVMLRDQLFGHWSVYLKSGVVISDEVANDPVALAEVLKRFLG